MGIIFILGIPTFFQKFLGNELNVKPLNFCIMYSKIFTRLFLLIGMIGMFSVPLRADEIQIGSGTEKSLYLPSYSYYHYSLSQQIYTAEELGGASGSIGSIAFYNDGTTQTRNLDIYMVNTNKASFTSNTDWISVAANDKVFSGNVTLTAGTWTTITLTTPFEYSGGNIAIMVDDNTGSCSSSNQHVQCKVFKTTGNQNQSLYTYRDGTDYNPLTLPPTGTGTTYINTLKNQIKLEIATAPVTCAKPTELEASHIAVHTAILDWTKGSDDQDTWEIYLTQTATDIPDEESEATFSGNVTKPFQLNNLASSSNYYAYVRANCGDTDGKSKWSAGCHFATICEAIETFPFTETFDDLTTNGEIPMCWNNEEGTTTNESYRWSYNSSYGTGHSGKCVRFDSYSNSNGNTNFLKTPVMSLPQSTAMQLRFWYKNPKGGDFSVFISTDGGQTHETALATGLTNAADWTEKTIDLSDYKGESNVVIAFKGTSNYGSNDARIYLDDVNIEIAPTCPKQNGLQVTALTSSSATLNWTAGNSEQDHWDLFITTDANITPSASTVPTVTNTDQKPYTRTSLNPETVYFAYVRARCSDTDQSDWTDACRFITPQIPVAVDGEHPYENDFESTCGWLFVNGDRPNQWCYGTAANNTTNGEKAIYISNNGGTSNTYTNTRSVVYATKAFSFAEGTYTFTYDWRAKGNQYFDYIRVALAPASYEIIASENTPTGLSENSLPTGWIALDGGSKLNNSDNWSTKIADEIQVAAGEYKMVVVWRNLTYTISQPPAAIDNISISLLTCPKPTLSYVSYSNTAYSGSVSWTGSTANAFEIAYRPTSDFDPSDYTLEDVTRVQLENLSEYTYTLENLTPETKYYIYVQADCGSEDGKSLWSNRTTFTTLPTCIAPSYLTNDGTTSSTVTLHWTKGADEQDAWQFRYKKTTDTEYTYLLVENQSSASYTLANLEPATSYHVNVRAWCGGDDYSKWSYANQTYDLTITTECAALSLPYACDFEGAVETGGHFSNYPMPKCWNRIEMQYGSYSYSYYPYVYTYSSDAHSGTKSLRMYRTPNSANETAILPEIDEAYAMNNLQIKFWAKAGSSNNTLSVGIMENDEFVEVSTAEGISTTYAEYTVLLSSYTGSGRNIAIKCGSSSSYLYYYIDDIVVEEIPSCFIPTGLTVTETSVNSASFTWEAGKDETAWNIQYKKATDNDWSEPIAVDATTYTLTGLQRASAYEARVQANCADDDQSDWTNPISFTTECGIWTIDAQNTLYEDFENVGASEFPPVCWQKFSYNMSGNSYWTLNSNNGLGSSAAFSYWSEGYAFLVMPQMHIDGDANLSFDYLISSGTYDESCSVVISTSEMTYSNFNQTIWSATGSNSGKASATVSLASFDGQDIYVAFKFKGSGTSGCTWYVDNVKVYVGKIFTKNITAYTPDSKDHYYLIASPIGTVSPENVTNILSNIYDLYRFNQSAPANDQGITLEWENYKQEGDNYHFNLELGKGYLYSNSGNGSEVPVTLTFTGTPIEGTAHNITLVKDDNAEFSGWNLIGNPFAEHTAYIGRPFYVMNENGTEILAQSVSRGIDPMEGVFVIANENNEPLTFSTTEPTKTSKALTLNLNNGQSIIDRAIVSFGEGQQLPKFQLDANSTKVYISKDSQDYAVVCCDNMGEMPVSFKAAQNGTYSININTEGTEMAYLHLIDNMTGADVDMLQSSSYSFEAKTTDYASRFKLVFVCGNTNDNNGSFAFYSNGSWVIANHGEATLQVIDFNGRILSSQQIEGCTETHINAASGIYMIRLMNGHDVKVQKIIIK